MNDGLKDKHRKAILGVLEKHPKIERVVLFGSRAMGTFTPTSDIDIALYGNLSMQDQARIAEELDELPIPYAVDLVRMKTVTSPELLAHVKEHGKEWTPHEPNGWEETTIGEIATLQRGFDIAKTEQTNGVVPVISSGGISSYHNEAKHTGPGVLLGRKGTLGSVYWAEIPHWPHSTTLWVKDFHGNDPKYIYYFFKAMGPELLRMDVGAANPTLNRNHVHPLPALRPPLAEQKAIAAVLGALDDKIELNRRMNATLEAMARALFQSWFIDFDPVRANLDRNQPSPQPSPTGRGSNDREKAELPSPLGRRAGDEGASGFLDGRQPAALDPATAALFPEHLDDSKLGHIPKGWRACTLGDIAKNVSITFDFKRTPEVVFINTGDVLEGDFLHSKRSHHAGLPGQAKKSIRPDDILFSEIRPANKRYAYVDFDSSDYVVSTKFMIIRGSTEMHPRLLYQILTAKETLDEFQVQAESRSGTFPQITFDSISHLPIVLPPIEIQEAFQRAVVKLDAQIKVNKQQSRTLATLRDTLLPKLLSGELSVAALESPPEAAR